MVTFRRAIWPCSSFSDDFHHYHPSHSAVLYPDCVVWIYFWAVDGCYYILFCSSDGSAVCIYRLSHSGARIDRTLADLLHVNQTRGSCHRKTTQAAFPNPTSALPVQCYELSVGSVADFDTAHLRGLHSALPVQSDYPYQSGSVYPFFQRLSRQA